MLSYADFAFILKFNRMISSCTRTPWVQTHSAHLEMMKSRIQRTAGASCPPKPNPLEQHRLELK